MSAASIRRPLARALVAAAALACAAPTAAQDAGEVVQRRSDLDEVKRRIRELQKEIADTEESRSSAAEELQAAERAVSRAERRVRQLAAERAAAEQSLALLEAERQAVEARIGARQDELADWLRRHYVHAAAGGVAPLLSARDPNQLARDAYYLEHLGKARLALIESLRSDLREKAQLAESIAARRDRVTRLEADQIGQRVELESVQAVRKAALAGLAEHLRTRHREVQGLRSDEQRLARLVAALARQAAEREAARAAAARAAAVSAARPPADRPPAHGKAPGARSEQVVGEVRQAAGPTPTGVSFAQLRGKMRFPVRGELVGRFGAPRAEGGTTWRGVFIRAGGGAEVRAVASGEVVFSDWLRGYGNLIILDHGNDYLSIYGNNDALLKEVGDAISGGDAIANVGAGGATQESGLYFEIRHRGQPLDPLQWVRLN
jgi:septal ring factor EnvC (AmiA/AmiB activator)